MQKKYYIIKSKYLEDNEVDKIMNKREIWEKFNIDNPQQKNPDYIHVDQHYAKDKSLWKYKSFLKSQIDLYNDKNNIDNKYKLIKNLRKLNNEKIDEMLLEQKKVNLYNIYIKKININKYKKLFDNNKKWIFKFIFSFGGENIIILESYKQFISFITEQIKKNKKKWERLDYDKYKKMSRWTKSYYFVEWVLQEYVDDPLLYNNKKFHLRGYYLFNKSENAKEGFILDNHRIFTAKENYKKTDYLNKDIHDSHFGSTSKYIDYKPDIIKLLKNKNLEDDIKYLFKKILKITKTNCYEENENCYNLFAYDIIITKDEKIKLIEINSSAGLPSYSDDFKKVNHPYKIFKGILESIVDKLFVPKEKIKKINNFIKI